MRPRIKYKRLVNIQNFDALLTSFNQEESNPNTSIKVLFNNNEISNYKIPNTRISHCFYAH